MLPYFLVALLHRWISLENLYMDKCPRTLSTRHYFTQMVKVGNNEYPFCELCGIVDDTVVQEPQSYKVVDTKGQEYTYQYGDEPVETVNDPEPSEEAPVPLETIKEASEL